MNGSTVIVVGRDTAALLHARELFEAAGLKVRDYERGREALSFVLSNQTEVAAVLADLALPDPVGGIDLIRRVAAACPTIALLTTDDASTSGPDDLPAGARFLARPWDPLDVLNAILDFHQSM